MAKNKSYKVALYVRIPKELDDALDTAIAQAGYGTKKGDLVALALAAHVEKLGIKVDVLKAKRGLMVGVK